MAYYCNANYFGDRFEIVIMKFKYTFMRNPRIFVN